MANQRSQVSTYISPCDEDRITFAAKGMLRRMGTETHKSWALSHIHITFIDSCLEDAFHAAQSADERHKLVVAGTVHFIAYLGWLRGGKLFRTQEDYLTITTPAEGPTRDIPLGVGAVEINLGLESKTDPTQASDVVMAFTTLSGIILGKWLLRLRTFRPNRVTHLFPTNLTTLWTSHHFRQLFAIPLLEMMRVQREPTLQAFSDELGNRLQDKIYSLHSWHRGDHSRVSQSPHHNEPNPKGNGGDTI